MLKTPQFSGLRFKFSPEEDEILKSIVVNNKFESWTKIAEIFNAVSKEMMLKTPVLRNERQCRDRWYNYLAPEVNRSAWTPEEDSILLSKYAEFGPRWSLISRFLKGRKDNMIKNRIKLLTRRQKAAKNTITKENHQETSNLDLKLDDNESIFNLDLSNFSFLEII